MVPRKQEVTNEKVYLPTRYIMKQLQTIITKRGEEKVLAEKYTAEGDV